MILKPSPQLFLALAGIALFLLVNLMAETKPRPEVGNVEWQRDFEGALAQSTETGKPVFAFFQEVPGCAGCQQFGQQVLTHPLLVEAIESAFVPVLIYNNQPGKDREILERYKEPAWNYQVVRFLDGKGKDLIPRKDRVWTLGPLVERMVATLERADRPVPPYLQALADESDQERHAKTAFAMSCFWTGEMRLGAIDGVVATEAGWLDGREVTLVTWHRDRTNLKELVKAAEQVRCAERVAVATQAELAQLPEKTRLRAGLLTDDYRPAQASDQKKQLSGTAFTGIRMTPMQAAKVNAWARVDIEKALAWLTPTQRRELESISGAGR